MDSIFMWENRMAKSFVAYLRVSTDKQGADGNGIDAQRDSVARYVADSGAPLIDTYVEVESAASHNLKNRPQLQAALAHAKRSKSVLLIAKLDRLSRSVLVTSQLLAANVEFVAVDFPQANRLTIQLMAVMAEHESRLISERTKAAMRAAKARGARFGASQETLVKATAASLRARRLRASNTEPKSA
jgi:DNA invertase Pin-like site-specific DNA recombinase